MICHKPQLNWNYLHQLSHPLGAAFAVPCWYQIRLLMTLIGRTFAAVHPEHVSSLIVLGKFTPLLSFWNKYNNLLPMSYLFLGIVVLGISDTCPI